MTSIQKKILILTSVILAIMVTIWIALTYYNYKTQNQYNDILQRYISLNEVTSASQQVITDLNNYMLTPSAGHLRQLNLSKGKIQEAKYEIFPLRNEENDFALTNYINLIDSLLETTDRLIMFISGKDMEAAAIEFSEATRISNYIAEMKLTILDTELKTYDRFYRNIIVQSEELIKLGVWLILLITFILLFISYWFSLSITRPVYKLTQAANELSKGKFDIQIDVESNDEISFLAKTFDRMRININNLISEIKQKAQLEHELQQNKLLLQESQFRSLQSQINPHFLFNTLNTLSKKAYLEGSEETSDLLVSVASLLRYNLKRIDRAVTLAEEVAVLRQYMDIQKARFTQRLKFFIEIDESCLDLKIPALTLQPIIENAVIHAVEPKEEGGTIWFRIFNQAEWITLEIEDDGTGMPKEKIEQILNERTVQTEGHSTGIGFSNVVKRLRLFYGYEDVLLIESTEGKGTKVIIKILKKRSK
ncbi:sensor histidine kinase [Robertmurraya yapensis]|uniref:histidine kinase n=1 Tax=Bacillus yapensis TaxID=2492960 RepID=A0A431W9U2_9BACI|nr:sensor histidine kinase [Bacillus yapensis]RTR32274.1 sensor histidine kinase [Bacillus yapensis]TKS96468.1 HAMP domain-containing protein [Bacillus yapensis]